MPSLTAPVGVMTGRRRPLRPWHVLATIGDLLIVTWEAPRPALASVLPPGLQLWSRSERALISAVLFRNRSLRPARLHVPRVECSQVNIRIYLADAHGRPGAVYFHALCLGSPLLARLSRPLTGVPFRPLPFAIDVDRAAASLSWRASSRDDDVRVTAREAAPASLPDAATLDLLTNVHTGVVAAPGSRLKTWSIWHRQQDVRLMAIDDLRIAPLAELGLPLGDPLWTFYVASVDYEVYLPARPAPSANKPGGDV
jgi:uncharacterized protein YqjF (DUF2071 family)